MSPFFPQLSWELDTLLTGKFSTSYSYFMPKSLRKGNYAISALRFWFIYHFLLAENANRKALTILELQADKGQLLDYVRQAADKGYPAVNYREWQGLVPAGDSGFFRNRHYSAILSDQTARQRLPANKYDVLIMPSSPSGLEETEFSLKRWSHCVKPNGIIIGLFNRQALDRSTDGRFLFCFRLPKFLRLGRQFHNMAEKAGYSVDFLSGGYYKRDHGLVPQEHEYRFRLNLLLGSLFPGQAGEIFWVLRK